MLHVSSLRTLCVLAIFLLISVPLVSQDGDDGDGIGSKSFPLTVGLAVSPGEMDAIGSIDGCTATLITRDLVLTAAHCVCPANWKTSGCATRRAFTLTDVLLFDDPSTSADESQTRQNFTVWGDVSVHPEYEQRGWQREDIALIQLDESPVDFVQNLTPIPVELPYITPLKGDTLTLVGYGHTGSDCSQPSGVKYKLSLDVTSSNWAAILFEYNQGGCPGDSGGPVINQRGNVVGVASWISTQRDINNKIISVNSTTYRPTCFSYNWIFGIPNRSWSSKVWIPVEAAGINSHSQGSAWCPADSFMVGFDLDGNRSLSAADSPVVGKVQCASIPNVKWGTMYWAEVGGIRSHNPYEAWCQEGSFLVGFDLDQYDSQGRYDPLDAPIIGRALCATIADSDLSHWGSSYWIAVGAVASHNAGDAWCVDGAFMTQFDLDRLDSEVSPDAYDAPIVGQAKCSRPH